MFLWESLNQGSDLKQTEYNFYHVTFFLSEKNNSVGLMSRAKEMRNELTAEKSKNASIEKRFQEQLMHQQAEMEALKARMQHTHEQHLVESNSLQARLHQAEKGGDRAAVQKISEVNSL